MSFTKPIDISYVIKDLKNSKLAKQLPNKEERLDLRAELDSLERQIDDLKVLYEQYFSGVVFIAPDKQHQDLKRLVRKLRKAPFKSSAMAYRLRSLENRYNTHHTYWQRVLREKDAGTYARDVFKANLRERFALEDKRADTSVGKASKSMTNLFDSYRNELERVTGKVQNVNFDSFQSSLIKKAKEFKAQHGVNKLSFKIVVKDGKVTIQAKAAAKENHG